MQRKAPERCWRGRLGSGLQAWRPNRMQGSTKVNDPQPFPNRVKGPPDMDKPVKKLVADKLTLQLAALSPAQIRAAGMLASGMRAREVSAALKVAPETVSRWRQMIPEFEALINLYVQETIDATRAGLHDLSAQATAELGKLLKSESEATRIKVIQLIFETVTARFDLKGSDGDLVTDPDDIAESRESDARISELIKELTRNEKPPKN